MLLPVRAPVSATVVDRSKQFDPSTCTAPLTEPPDALMLPAIVRGSPPEALEIILNCQLPAIFGPGVGEVIPPVPRVGRWYPAPPHPQSRRSAASPKILARRFMESS